jgi:hypothetical protein
MVNGHTPYAVLASWSGGCVRSLSTTDAEAQTQAWSGLKRDAKNGAPLRTAQRPARTKHGCAGNSTKPASTEIIGDINSLGFGREYR